MNEQGFDSEKYLEEQTNAFQEALSRDEDKPVFMEFGGKPFHDHHAERVLPGYDSETKAEILKETVKLAEVVVAVNSLDLLKRPDGRTLRGRIRGDYQLDYDQETLRLIDEAHKKQIPIDKVVLAVTPREMSTANKKLIDKFRSELEQRSTGLYVHHQIKDYPDPKVLEGNPFADNDSVRGDGHNLVVISPGGGSGKFGVLLSEMYDSLEKGETPDFVKFETFPIYQLDAKHALNLAFEAATADLGNKVMGLKERGGQTRTSYDKDIENFELLKKMFEMFGKHKDLTHMEDAVDMGINQVVKGITDMQKIVDACYAEICRRIARYESEVKRGIEKESTVEIAREVLGKFKEAYRVQIS